MKQNLKGISETLMVPLWARAMETKHDHPIIKDKKALEMMDHIEYDFSIFESKRMPQVSIAIRTEILDRATWDFMEIHPEGCIINLGCGLDTRFSRLGNDKIHWYDLDLEEPVRIRKHFFSETKRYQMIARSIFDYSWIKDVGHHDHVLLIAEGLLMYFKEDKVKSLMNKLVREFSGAEMLLEVTTPLLVERHKKQDPKFERNIPFLWGISSGKEMEKFNPKIEVINEWNYFDYHKDRRKKAKITLNREDSGRIVHLKFK
jgi:O-methyltransferase involved in polyketide biosynthesis